jgi:hypothetical protein
VLAVISAARRAHRSHYPRPEIACTFFGEGLASEVAEELEDAGELNAVPKALSLPDRGKHARLEIKVLQRSKAYLKRKKKK